MAKREIFFVPSLFNFGPRTNAVPNHGNGPAAASGPQQAIAPVARTDLTFTSEATAVVFHVLANDTDADGDALTIGTIQDPEHGNAFANPDGTMTYIPDVGFTGMEIFYYSAIDETGKVSFANVYVTVTAAPDTVVLPGEELFALGFEYGPDGAVYSDDIIVNSNNPLYAKGGIGGGALSVTLGGVDGNDILDMSGSWRIGFFLAETQNVVVTFRYSVTMLPSFETLDQLDVLFAFDQSLVGLNGEPAIGSYALLAMVAALDTGWIEVELDLGDVAPGSHLIDIGGYLSSKDQISEVASVLFDDLAVYLNDASDPDAHPEPSPKNTTLRLTSGADNFKMRATNEELDAGFDGGMGFGSCGC